MNTKQQSGIASKHVLSASSSSEAEDTTPSTSTLLPSLKSIQTDPFMKQVEHGSQLASLLMDNNDATTEEQFLLKELLTAQLQHSDGIRGFFVSFLTAGTMDDTNTEGDEDEFTVPSLLLQAMTEGVSANSETSAAVAEELLSFACMNVIMPTATSSMHTDPILMRSSSKTALRGIKVLSALKGYEMYSDGVLLNCRAIHAAATSVSDEDAGSVDVNVDAGLFKYWKSFIERYRYGEQQQRDIAEAVDKVMSA
eukprot:CAMPEP_0196810974 /NCGR_PEP_ID=MMETSP1362-20130617/15963_1 /TAXON_ID=163516 /ORGANISM="Leptocylindrus danicus, Strain CCMP1856" /LENGTH=252 /DNA_ID=CAMNT_0042186187 /DNA_START=288 /DNA_END=1046 /DNA_ORIENTATION=+